MSESATSCGVSAPESLPPAVESRHPPPFEAGTYTRCRFHVKLSDSRSRCRLLVGSDTSGRERAASMQREHLSFVKERIFGRLSEEEIRLLLVVFRKIAEGADSTDG